MFRPNQRFCSLTEAAEYLGYNERTLRNRIATGDLRAYQSRNSASAGKRSRSLRIRIEDLDALLVPVPTTGTDRAS